MRFFGTNKSQRKNISQGTPRTIVILLFLVCFIFPYFLPLSEVQGQESKKEDPSMWEGRHVLEATYIVLQPIYLAIKAIIAAGGVLVSGGALIVTGGDEKTAKKILDASVNIPWTVPEVVENLKGDSNPAPPKE